MHPLKKIVTGLAFATAGLLPLSAGAVTAPSMADAHTNSALPANSITAYMGSDTIVGFVPP